MLFFYAWFSHTTSVHTLCGGRSIQKWRGPDGKVVGSRVCLLAPWPLSAELPLAQTSPAWLAAGPDPWWHWSHAATVCQDHIKITWRWGDSLYTEVLIKSPQSWHTSSSLYTDNCDNCRCSTELQMCSTCHELSYKMITCGSPFRFKLSLLIYLDHLSFETTAANIWGRVPQSLLLSWALLRNKHLAILNTAKSVTFSFIN